MTPAVTVIAVLFLGMGLVALVKPAFVGTFFDVRFDSVDGRNEVRAVYGGFGVAMCVVLVVALREPALRDGVLVCAAVALLGMVGGRVVAALLDGRPGLLPWLFCGVEIVLALVLLAAR